MPREELPEKYQPHSSFYNKMANWAAGKNHKKPKARNERPGLANSAIDIVLNMEQDRPDKLELAEK